MTGLWPWLALAGLGAFHGLNPAMGWLFAVALGLHRGSRRVVLVALVPIAAGPRRWPCSPWSSWSWPSAPCSTRRWSAASAAWS